MRQERISFLILFRNRPISNIISSRAKTNFRALPQLCGLLPLKRVEKKDSGASVAGQFRAYGALQDSVSPATTPPPPRPRIAGDPSRLAPPPHRRAVTNRLGWSMSGSPVVSPFISQIPSTDQSSPLPPTVREAGILFYSHCYSRGVHI